MSDYEAYQLMNSLNNSNSGSYGSLAGPSAGTEIWSIIALILAIVGGILVYFLFVKSKTSPKSKFAKSLKDFLNFKIIWLEPILKIFYYFLTIFIILSSFSFLGMINSLGGTAFVYFLAYLILGPIVLRIIYEITMMFIMIWRNTKDIADNTAKKK